MPKNSTDTTTLKLYGGTGLAAIIVGGVLAAFCAKNPTTPAVWASAYLVLVLGVLQAFFGVTLKHLAGKSVRTAVDWAWGGYNAGSLLVMYSTLLKYEHMNHLPYLYTGSALLVLAMFSMLYATKSAPESRLKLVFYVLVAIILISVPSGLVLSGK